MLVSRITPRCAFNSSAWAVEGGLGDDVRVVVGQGQSGVDQQFGDSDAAEFAQEGEAAKGNEAFAAVVDGGFNRTM